MHRFFLNQTSFEQETIPLFDPKEIHHLKNVLRLKPKQQIQIFNAQGQEIVGTITTLTKDRIEIRRDYTIPAKKEKSIHLILACALPKRAKFEFIIEKCTELGVDEIIPLKTERTEVFLNEERAQKKKDRYQTVAINAAKQSGRRDVPKIHPPQEIPQALHGLGQDTIIFIPCLAGIRESFQHAFKQKDSKTKIAFFIGPEGDFTIEEINLVRQAGGIPVSLGNLVLKVDTAALAVVSFASLFYS